MLSNIVIIPSVHPMMGGHHQPTSTPTGQDNISYYNHHYHHQLPLRISKTIRLEKHIKFYEQSRNIKCTTPSTISLLPSRIPSAPGLFFGASIGCWQSWCYSFSYCCCCCFVMCHTYCSWCCVESCSVAPAPAPAAAPDVVLIVSVFMQTHLNNWRTFLPFPFRKDSKDNYYFFSVVYFYEKIRNEQMLNVVP